MRVLPHPAPEAIELTEVLRALADPVRLNTVACLAAEGEMKCGDLSSRAGVHKSTATHHLRTLREAGLVTIRQEGRLRFVKLRRADLESRFPGLLDSVLAARQTSAKVS
jgi:DNA-binding transcriptional ArsR family regulator